MFRVGSVGFVLADDKVHTPRLDTILRSTTLIRCADLWTAREGEEGFVFEDITLAFALENAKAKEMIGFGGGNVTAIMQLDGSKIGSGAPGPVFEKLLKWVEEDKTSGEFVDAIPYE
jgi:branched-subunit amino acid aminotransferase/4-amino-4-deoxychorismate lyase